MDALTTLLRFWTPKEKAPSLYDAAKSGNLDTVKALIWGTKTCNSLSLNEYINAKNSKSDTPFHGASKNGHVEIVRYLLENGADFTTKGKDNWTCLQYAVFWRQMDVIQALVDFVRSKNKPEILRGFICSKDRSGDSALQLAVAKRCVYIVEYLLNNGTNCKTSDENGLTPLHDAVSKGHKEMVFCLLKHVRDSNSDILSDVVNAQDAEGNTPLHCAAEEGNLDILKHLLENGAIYDIKTKENKSPLHSAVLFNQKHIIGALLQHIRNIDPNLVLNFINSGNKYGKTILHLAAIKENYSDYVFMLQNGATPFAKDIFNRSPLHDGAENGFKDFVVFLVKHVQQNSPEKLVAFINAKDKYGRSPIYYGIKGGHEEIVKFLFENGAQVKNPGLP